MALRKLKLVALTFIGSIVLAAPVYAAEQVKTIFEVLTEFKMDPNIIMGIFLFLLLWGLFSMALDVIKKRMGVQNPYLIYLISGTLAGAGTYFSYGTWMWNAWASLFRGGIFVMAGIMLLALVLFVASFFLGGMATFREKRKESLEHVEEIEIRKEKGLVAEAKRLATEEEYRMGYVDKALRQVSKVIPGISELEMRDPVRAQQILKAEVPALLKRLQLAHKEVMAAIKDVKLEEKDIEYAAKKVKKTLRAWEKIATLSKKAAEKAGAETAEIEDLKTAENNLLIVIKESKKARKILPRIDRLIKDAEAEIEAAKKLEKQPSAARERWIVAEEIITKAIGLTDKIIKYADLRKRVFDPRIERLLEQADWLAIKIRKGQEHPRVVLEKEAVAIEKKIIRQLKSMVKKAPARSQASKWLKAAERAMIRAELTTNLLKKLEKLKLAFADVKRVQMPTLQNYKNVILAEEKELNRIITEMRKY